LVATCSRCQGQFEPRSNFAKWCDACCTYRCCWCGQQFTSRRNRNVRFCSLVCTNAWQDTAKEEARQRTLAIRGRGHVQRCVTCGETFYVPGWRLDRGDAKYCSHGCRNYREDMKGINRVLRFPARNGLNGLESAGKAILYAIGVSHLDQEVIGGKFVVDVLIPDRRIVIQWDGDFWHGNPAVYPALTPIQATNAKRDKACNAYLAKCGYQVLIGWRPRSAEPWRVRTRRRLAVRESGPNGGGT
jgi:G:T-mismatch repair DNA endonuclease (very short patch repair protein)